MRMSRKLAVAGAAILLTGLVSGTLLVAITGFQGAERIKVVLTVLSFTAAIVVMSLAVITKYRANPPTGEKQES